MAACALFLTATAVAQSGSAPIKGMASTVGLYVYPKSHQTSRQQLSDESQCYADAKTQTGYDPDATSTAAKTDDKKSGDKPVAKGAMRGAVISGATGGGAAAGARRGAIMGSVRAKREDKKEGEQADKQADGAKTASKQSLDNFKRSLSACLDARGYSVK